MSQDKETIHSVLTCYHCGDMVSGEKVEHDGKVFCCSGCKLVFEILEQNDLCRYYSIQSSPGRTPSAIESARFDFLDDESMRKKLLQFNDGNRATAILSLPSIHCSSCIWLLEQLYRLDSGVIQSRVDFLKRQVTVTFDQTVTSLKNIVILLSSIGYEPELTLDTADTNAAGPVTRSLYYKIGVAGFCFGNSMLFSFPEYLGFGSGETILRPVFSYLNILLALPVFFYSGADYFTSAWKGLRRKIVNIDVPIALGMFILFSRSLYEIITHTGPGFIDSMCGLVFFLLIGRVFQSKTYDRLNFERTYKSYFPLSVTVKRNGTETTIPLSSLTINQRIVIRNNEIIPADSILLRGNASIDYGFVTGESVPVEKVLGEMIYAGGRQVGGAIELEVMKEISQSYLTQLWNNFHTDERDAKGMHGNLSELSNTVSKYFTAVVLVIGCCTGLFWLQYDFHIAMNALTGIFIVACPCALAISIPFTLGTTLRIFGKNNFYLKNTSVIETLSKVDTVIVDKTGTITHPRRSTVDFIGAGLSDREKNEIHAVVKNSIHPLSKIVKEYLAEQIHGVILSPRSGRRIGPNDTSLPDQHQNNNDYENVKTSSIVVDQFMEISGKGVSAIVNNCVVRIGSKAFAGNPGHANSQLNESRVYVSIDGIERGYFSIKNMYREGLGEIIAGMKDTYGFSVVSGDNESERIRLQSIFPPSTDLRFNQMPNDKYNVVSEYQSKNKKVVMIGDGLNDAGALMKSDVGIAITEDTALFTPSSDAILAGSSFTMLPAFLRFTRTSVKIVVASFVFALIYNVAALYFAVQGELSPIMAAILMPLSSISIVLFTTLTTRFFAKRRGLLS